jgi:hypothetical protein
MCPIRGKPREYLFEGGLHGRPGRVAVGPAAASVFVGLHGDPDGLVRKTDHGLLLVGGEEDRALGQAGAGMDGFARVAWPFRSLDSSDGRSAQEGGGVLEVSQRGVVRGLADPAEV